MLGYNANFLAGIELPLPTFSPELAGDILTNNELRNGQIADYVNYSVITNKETRSPVLVAVNLDQNKLKSTERRKWKVDSRIGADYQLNNDYYRNNPWDRGHMARRATVSWADTKRQAQRASDESMFYSNACLQHENLNQDEWLCLEDWVKGLDIDVDGRISTFSGPIYGELGRAIRPAGRRVAMTPSGFFKIICFKNKITCQLDVRAFVMYQDAVTLADKSGRHGLDFQTYQVTVSEIEQLTGLEFDDEIYQRNPLYFRDSEEARDVNVRRFPERHEVSREDDILSRETPREVVRDDEVDVFIAAAMVNPDGEERAGEWVSLINLSNKEVDLTGWTLSDMKRGDLSLDAVLADGDMLLKPGEARVIQPLVPLMLANTGGVIMLKNKDGERVDRVKYLKNQAKPNVAVNFLSRL